jgi:hypothetical protein
MPCIASLPDGTFLILNGALQGVAGFGLASNPNLGAVLYDPTQPIGSRMSILNNTIIARLYHSEATLLPDGRVLVSGSDPQTDFPNGTVKYPEEYRIEVTSPFLSLAFLNAIPIGIFPGLCSSLSHSRIHPAHIYHSCDRLGLWRTISDHERESRPKFRPQGLPRCW